MYIVTKSRNGTASRPAFASREAENIPLTAEVRSLLAGLTRLQQNRRCTIVDLFALLPIIRQRDGSG